MTIRTHTDEEIAKIEKETGQKFDHWERVGGKFMDRWCTGYDKKTGSPIYAEAPADVGGVVEIPVFTKKKV